MITKELDFMDVFKTSWEYFTKNALLLIALPLGLAIVLAVIYSFAMFFMMLIPFMIILFPFMILLEVILSLYILMSAIKAVLSILKGETPSWEVLKNDIMTFLKFAAIFIIIGLAATIPSFIISIFSLFVSGTNMFLFLISSALGIIITIAAAVLFFPAQFIIIDKKISIIDTFKNSLNITLKNIPQCLIFTLICFALNFVGAIPFGLGLIITIPVSVIAAAIVYKKFDEEIKQPPAQETAAQTELISE